MGEFMKRFFLFNVIFITFSLVISGDLPKKEKNLSEKPDYSKYVGDWVGTGFGWEVRFKHSAKQFVQQFGVNPDELGFKANEETIMTLLVQHSTTFNFYVDENGDIEGTGSITYNLIPNLCGVAALTQQVNEAVNMMDKIPMIFKWTSEVGEQAIRRFNANFFEEEAKLANVMEHFVLAGTKPSSKNLGSFIPKNEMERRVFLQAWFREQTDDDVLKVVQTVIQNRCKMGGAKFLNGLECSLIGVPPKAVDLDPAAKVVFDKALDLVYEFLGDFTQKKFQSLSLESQKDEQLCQLGAGMTARAGDKIGPMNFEEMVTELLPTLGKAAFMDIATGGLPVGMMLSLPGVTQVQYYYKGLPNGPEKRKFKIKGRMEIMGGQPRIKLEMDGDVEGDKNLYVEYTVNYQTDRPSFPTWSPFTEKDGKVMPFGEMRTYERKTIKTPRQFKDKATGEVVTIEIPKDVTVAKDFYVGSPFVTFRETGRQRNNVKVWHNYEYVWNAFKITEPEPR